MALDQTTLKTLAIEMAAAMPPAPIEPVHVVSFGRRGLAVHFVDRSDPDTLRRHESEIQECAQAALVAARGLAEAPACDVQTLVALLKGAELLGNLAQALREDAAMQLEG